MKSVVIVHSYHHNNTLKIAKAIAASLDAKVEPVNTFDSGIIADYELIGLGSGIDSAKHYKELLDFAHSMPENQNGATCFIFSTSAVQGEDKVYEDHTALRDILHAKGYSIAGEFSCKGFNTNSFLKFFGGMNKEHPNENDIACAHAFAQRLADLKFN